MSTKIIQDAPSKLETNQMNLNHINVSSKSNFTFIDVHR